MAKKLTVLQSFEQGMDRRDGGVIKLIEGAVLPVEQTDTAATFPVAGKNRSVPSALLQKWVDAGLVKIDEAA